MDPASGIGIPVAFGAGLVSFLSPCVLPLVPGYISAVAGVTPEEIQPRRVLWPSLAFVASFSTIFIALGLLGQQALRGALTGPTALKVSGAIIVAMGILFVLAPFVPRLSREWHVSGLMKRAGRGGPVLTGAAFAIAWTPCVGPTLGAILSLASNSSTTGTGALLLAVYSAGLAIPFLFATLAFNAASRSFAFFKRHYAAIQVGAGVVLIAMGVLVFTGELFHLNIEAQKALDRLGIDFFNV